MSMKETLSIKVQGDEIRCRSGVGLIWHRIKLKEIQRRQGWIT